MNRSILKIAQLIAIQTCFAQIQVFSPNSASNYDEVKLKKKHPDMTISINPYMFGRGMFGIHPEVAINDVLTFKFGLGVTSRDYIMEGFLDEAELFNSGSSNKTFSYVGDGSDTKLGFFTEGGFKFYPSEHDEMEGFYLYSGIRYRTYRIFLNDSDLYVNTINLSYNMIEPNFRLGYSYESFWVDGLYIDSYLGIGYSALTRKGYIEEYINNSRQISLITDKNQRILPFLGASLGFMF